MARPPWRDTGRCLGTGWGRRGIRATIRSGARPAAIAAVSRARLHFPLDAPSDRFSLGPVRRPRPEPRVGGPLRRRAAPRNGPETSGRFLDLLHDGRSDLVGSGGRLLVGVDLRSGVVAPRWKAHRFRKPGERRLLHFGLGDEVAGEDPLAGLGELGLLRFRVALGETGTADLDKRGKSHALRNPVEIVGSRGPPPSSGVDAEQLPKMVVKGACTLAGKVDAGLERPGDDMAKPGSPGLFGERTERVKARRA